MVLMMALPAASWSYAVRTMVTAGLLVAGWLGSRSKVKVDNGSFFSTVHLHLFSNFSLPNLLIGFGFGILTLLIWIAPDGLEWYRHWCVIGDPYHDIVKPGGWLLWMQLFGSAFVISVAEELFFRQWLIRFAGFGWMVALFAIEHDRYVVGAIAGVIYGLLFLKRGLFAAIVAHATTNLLLGLYVIQSGHWEFW